MTDNVVFKFVFGFGERIFVLLSQTGNAIFLYGNPDETISARCYRHRNEPIWSKAYEILNTVFFWDEDHCYESHVKDLYFAGEILRQGERDGDDV